MSEETSESLHPVSRKSTGHMSDDTDNAAPRACFNEPPQQNYFQSISSETFNNNNQAIISFMTESYHPSANSVHQSIWGQNVAISGGVHHKNTIFYVNEDRIICKWLLDLSLLKPEKKQYRYAEVAREGGGVTNWVLQSPKFTQWRDGDLKRLWCYGIPGAGKTILASLIINHLEIEFAPRHKDTACVYIYFDHHDQEHQTLFNLIASLFGQLLGKSESISDECRRLYRELTLTRQNPTTDALIELFDVHIAKYFSKVFLIIDALDDCPNDPKTNCLDKLLDALRCLSDNAHILFLSRHDREIELKLQADDQFEFVPREADISAYVRNRMESRKELAFVDEASPDGQSLMDKITDTVVARSKGMFLLARLDMDCITSQSNLEDLTCSITNLDTFPKDFYDTIMARICSQQNETKRKLAIDILMWLAYARRPLTSSELVHAVSLRPGDKALAPGWIPREEMLTSVCAGLVRIDAATNKVGFAHDTVREYLQRKGSEIFIDVQPKIAETCLRYLLFETFDHDMNTGSEAAEIRRKYPFLSYAANNWGYHVAQVPVKGEAIYLAYDFFNQELKVANAFRFMGEPRFQSDLDISGLHIAAYFGADYLTKKLLKRGMELNQVTNRGETALHWAVTYRQKRVVRALIKGGADLNIQDVDGLTALHKAIKTEDSGVIALILCQNKRLNLDIADKQGWTVLRWAVKHSPPDIVRRLLQSEADPNSQDGDGWTAMRWATKRGNKEIIELLIKSNASLHMPTPDQWTLLVWAAKNGVSSIISRLVEDGVDLNEADDQGMTALRWAIDYGHSMTAWMLIQAGANLNKPDKKGHTPLYSIVKNWNGNRDKSLVWLLLENKARVDARTEHGLTALHIAAMNGFGSVVWLLLEKGANPRRVDNSGRTSLHCAVEGGHIEVSRMLIQRAGELLDIADGEGRRVLHTAAFTGNLGMVLFLLDYKVNVTAEDAEGYTAADRARSQGYEEVTAVLVKKGASVNDGAR